MRFIQAMMLTVLAMSLGGCALLGWAADVVEGGKPVKPVYQLQDQPTVVMIDDPTNKLPTVDLPNLIAGRINDRLVDEQVIDESNMVAANRISQLAADHSAFKTWPIDKVGKEAGAQQVIYVLVKQFMLSDESQMYRPVAQVRVKVIDVASGQRLYPATGDGHPVAVEQFYKSMDGANRSTQTIIARRLAEELAREIAYLFYEHLPPQPGERLPG